MKTNKLLSVALTLCVLLAAFSLTAFAAKGVTKAEDLTAALAAGGEVRLDADITGVSAPVTVPAGVTATLDLAGHTLEGNNQGTDQAFLLVNGKLTLTDSVGTGKICSTYTGRSGLVVSVVGGELTVAGGTITTEGMAQAGNAVNVGKGGVLKMTGGKVYADAKRGNYAIRIGGSDAVFTMTGGIAEADSSTTVTYITAIGVSSTGTVTIGGDSVVRGPEALTTTSLTALTVTGGSFTGEVSAPKNSISGGTFTTDVTDYLADENVKICEKQADGTYQVLTAAYAAAKIIAADGTATRYGTFARAVAALKDGDTLVMLDDIGTAAEPRAYGIVVTANNVTLNMNGKVLTVGYDAAAATAAGVPGYAAGVGIVNGGSGLLTVSGNGTVDVSNYTGTDGIAVWARTGSITVQSGTFINKSNEEATVYVGTNDGNSPVLKIADGTYKNIAEGNYKYDESRTPLTFNIYNGKTADALKISGGKFYGNNDPYLGDDQVKGRILTYATTGVRKDDGYYVVAAGQAIQLLDANGGAKDCSTDVTKAFAGAADGDTLILLKNTSVSKQLNVTKAVTIDLGGHTLTNSYAGSGYSLLTRAAVTMKNGTYKSTKASARGIGAVADFTLEKATLSAAGLVGLGCSAADATYTVKDSTVIGNYAIANFANNAKINIEENSTITGKDVGIYHNGSNSGLKLTATDSTITAAATGATNGIYVSGSTDTMTAAGAQQVTLTNCTVSGGTAVEVKYTDLTLTDCKVTATAETPSYTQDDNGATTTGFAVVSTDNSKGAATPAPEGKITIQGADGSYKGQVGLASLETVKTDYADFKDTTYAVSGGSFTKEVLPEYCAAGFIPTKNADDTYGVKAAPVAKIGTVEYATLNEAFAAAKDGEKVILLSDRKNFVTNTINANITIDLNGKTLSVGNNNPFFRTNGEVTIQNGTIDSQYACVIVNAYNKLTLKNVKITGVTGNNGKNLVNVCSNAEVTIDKDTVLTASGSNGAAVFIGQDADAKYTLNVYGKVIQESKSFAISGNGSYKGTTTINIYDGAEVKSASVAIYQPQAGVINVNGGLVEGYCAIGIKSGTLNINGGTVRGTADDHLLDDSNSTSGTIIYDGSAIVVDSRAAGYAGNVNINVTGGTVESCYSTAIREIGEQDKPNMTQLTKLNITGGRVLGASQQLGNVTNDMLVRDISSSNVSVSGGTFNHAVPETYCADGFVSAVNKDGTYTVAEKAENPFGKTFSVVNKPVMTQDGVDYYTVVVYSGIDSLNYKKAGFAYRMEATKKNNETVKAQDVRETTTAYKAISGTNNQGKTYTYTAEQIGAAYIYGQRFLFPVSDYTSANTALYVTPYVVTLDGKTIYGDEIELTETALSAKGSHLFWQGQ